MLSAIGSIGAALGSSLTSSAGNIVSTMLTNKTNKSIAKNNNAMAMELANTAHQREVEDLKKAGLNPILSASGSGAVTPALQQAQMQAPQIDMPSILNAVSNLMTSDAQAKNLNANTGKTTVETKLAPLIAQADIELKNAEGNLAKQKQIREKLQSEIDDIQKEYYRKTGTAPNMSHFMREAIGMFKTGKKAGEKVHNAFQALSRRKWDQPNREYFKKGMILDNLILDAK